MEVLYSRGEWHKYAIVRDSGVQCTVVYSTVTRTATIQQLPVIVGQEQVSILLGVLEEAQRIIQEGAYELEAKVSA